MPAERGLNDFVESLPSSPLERGLGERRVGVRGDRITWSSADDLVGHGAADDACRRVDHLEHGGADTGPEIDGDRGSVVRQAIAQDVERTNVGIGEILDMDVVPDARAVGGRVVPGRKPGPVAPRRAPPSSRGEPG